MAESALEYTFTHPVYLDTEMMESFLAFLEGGVSRSESETTTSKDARDRLLKARSGLKFKVFSAIDVDAGGEGTRQWKDEASRESKIEKHHTEASLFNILYQYLIEDEKLTLINGKEDLGELTAGGLVEISADFFGNPLEEMLAFTESILPYVSEEKEAKKNIVQEVLDAQRPVPKSGNPSKRSSVLSGQEQDILKAVLEALEGDDQSGVRMLSRMVEDIKRAPVHDLLMVMEDGTRAVLTVGSTNYSTATSELLRASEFRVIGKVTKVLKEKDVINLTRRTVLGAAGPEFAQNLVNTFSDSLDIDFTDPIVEAPGLQIIPLAIFV